MKLERLAISCGGTGGHFNPGLSIARELKARGGTPVLVLGGAHVEKQAKIASEFGIDVIRIEAAPISVKPWKAIPFLRKTWKGVGQCAAGFRQYRPQALLCMGSFASLPPALAAKRMGLPLFLHDGNAKIGKANRFLSRWAKALALSFPVKDASVIACPAVLTGMPLRPDLVTGVLSKDEAIAAVNTRWHTAFSAERPTLLVFGGSLGARTINTAVKIPDDLPGAERLQVIRLVGPGNLEAIRPLHAGSKAEELILESCQEMNLLYSAADLVICRSGGSTVSELAVYGKYAVLVPYPFAAEGHQDDNACWLASAGGAEIIPDAECSPERFGRLFRNWLTNRAEFESHGLKSKSLAMPRAGANVLDLIENILTSQENAGMRQ